MDEIFVHTIRSKDGDLIGIRPMVPDDAYHLVDLFDHMGPESRFLRFNLALTNPDRDLVWTEARRLARVDPERDGAWLAFADLADQPSAPVGGVRYVRLDEETAEAAIAVRDDMQNKGIGSELLKWLVEQAQEAGIKRLVATVQRNNRRLFHLLLRSELHLEYQSEGSYTTITAYLTGGEISK